MNEFEQWQENNNRYLSSALAWLRLRLARLAAGGAPEQPATAIRETQGSGWFSLLARAAQQSGSADKKNIDPECRKAAEAMGSAAQAEPRPALVSLVRRLGISQHEHHTLLLCVAMELDTGIAALCARAQGDANKAYPTFALAMALFDEPSWDILSPERPLRFWRLIEISQAGAQPLTASPLRADERIVNYAKGLNYLDDRLSPLMAPLSAADAPLPPSQAELADALAGFVHRNSDGPLPVMQLIGQDPGNKKLIASAAARMLGLHLYRIPVENLPQQSSELDTFARLWQREAMLLPIAPYVDAGDFVPADSAAQKISLLNRFFEQSRGLFFLDTRDVWPGIENTAVFEITPATPKEQLAVWKEAMGSVDEEGPALLAGQFNMNSAAIRRTVKSVQAEYPKNEDDFRRRLWNVCLMSARPRLDALAKRIAPKAGWDDLVLAPESIRLLRQVADQVRQRVKVYEEWGFSRKMNRGLGISALFAGESGTGKTMAAEVLANELRLDLYRIDLSQVVNKYIGETEKNLRRSFDAGEEGGTILFFDEADALFGKRSEVKDSHDRYANIEINYLLQRMEAYRGLAILATNMKASLDQAFMRRLRFIVPFHFPGVKERKIMWQKIYPAETPTKGLDFDRLAQLNLTGGAISNIAVNAAFLASASNTLAVTMELVLEAARAELRKQGKPINEAEFRLMQLAETRM